MASELFSGSKVTEPKIGGPGKPTTEIFGRAPTQPNIVKPPIVPVKQPEVKKQEDVISECLIYLRDNVVHGNQQHVDRINRALEKGV